MPKFWVSSLRRGAFRVSFFAMVLFAQLRGFPWNYSVQNWYCFEYIAFRTSADASISVTRSCCDIGIEFWYRRIEVRQSWAIRSQNQCHARLLICCLFGTAAPAYSKSVQLIACSVSHTFYNAEMTFSVFFCGWQIAEHTSPIYPFDTTYHFFFIAILHQPKNTYERPALEEHFPKISTKYVEKWRSYSIPTTKWLRVNHENFENFCSQTAILGLSERIWKFWMREIQWSLTRQNCT